MGDIIHLHGKPGRPSDNLITSGPWEFRRAYWASPNFIQMLRSFSVELEKGAVEGGLQVEEMPPHFALEGGLAYTIRSLYAHREAEGVMREIYYLAGLLDCMINQVNPILRTDLLRDMYKRIFFMREELGVNWYGPLDRVLLPLDPWLFDYGKYRSAVSEARTLKELYLAIRRGTDEAFDILSLEYVFYCPHLGG